VAGQATDIILGIGIVIAVSGGLFAAAVRAGRAWPPMVSGIVAIGVCAFLVVFCLFLHDSLFFARWLPFTNVVVLADCRVPAVAILVGLLWRRIDGPERRRMLLLTPLPAVVLIPSVSMLFQKPLELHNRWNGDVCMQTSHATCSPAAAATILRSHGIDTSEAEMARLCLTSPDGTSLLGLYRGLRLKTAGTGLNVQPFHGDMAALKSRVADGPVILSVGLRPGADVDPRYQSSWGWQPGVWHTVVLFGFEPDGRPIVGDPSVGRERWSVSNLDVLWHGDGIAVAGG
jgi:hypothetical protein